MITARLIALLLMTGPALAEMPPPAFDRPFFGTMEKHLVRYGQAARKCRALGAEVQSMVSGRHLYGCQFWRGDTCVVVYSYDPSGRDKKMASNVYRHERAHCLGWVHQ